MKKFFDIVIGTVIMFGFWGIMYPEFSLTRGSYEYKEAGEIIERDSVTDFYGLLEADEIVIKSKVFEFLKKELW